jgi:hypothetical protein
LTTAANCERSSARVRRLEVPRRGDSGDDRRRRTGIGKSKRLRVACRIT